MESIKNNKLITKEWGDLDNGFFKNPVLNTDFSDPDIIRVNEDFYMVCSDFHYMGMPVLHSKDLINWHIIGRIYSSLDISPEYDQMQAYGKGSWAPAIRFHKGLFYVYFCTPNEGLFMSYAKKPAGPWSNLIEVKRVQGWEDPCPFWDDDGNAYLGHSTVGAGPIIIHKMSPDGMKLLDDGIIVYIGKIAEGTKIYKRNNYYYLIIPEGGVEIGWQTALRSTSIYGPYDKKIILKQGNTSINGPHQGGIVELTSGETWFMHFQSVKILGRVCHLQPVNWIDNWPIIGFDSEPMAICKKPNLMKPTTKFHLQTSDDFNSSHLGLQWQWNHNPVSTHWSLQERSGYLRLKSIKAANIKNSRNTLTQKIIGYQGLVIIKMDISLMIDSQIAGLAFLGGDLENWVGIEMQNNVLFVKAITAGKTTHGPQIENKNIYLRADINLNTNTFFSFSFNGEDYIPIGNNCLLESAHWKGSKIGIFTFDLTGADSGYADFDWFYYDYE